MSIRIAYQSLRTFSTLIVFAAVASAMMPDARIVSLIPPNIEIVDGSGASPLKAGLMSFLVFRTENAVDLRDFRGLVGVDDSKAIRQIFLVGGTARPSPRFEHSLIALGRFNAFHMYKAAIRNGARSRSYRGMEILELDPFLRDKGIVNEPRWFAVLGLDLAVFGTIPHVREELDRYTDHVAADSILVQGLTRLRRDDETWCLFASSVEKHRILQALGAIDPRDLTRDSLQFHFGIHYGRRVRFDYEVTRSSPDLAALDDRHSGAYSANNSGVKSLVAKSGADMGFVHGTISVSKTRYGNWLSELSEPGRYERTTSPKDRIGPSSSDRRTLLCSQR